ncbi:MAG: MarR family winged helix-turn-helix transcriptional regulator [Acidobacteriota bacterium]|nr:MarR family winged helix-turn-helix transcriptional regulator [Acidobacteriota bacterium]
MAKRSARGGKASSLDGLSTRVMELARLYQLRSRDRACRFGITVSQCYALEAIVERGGVGVTALAGALALDKSNASRVAESLIAIGLAAVEDVPGNARAKRLIATSKGGKLAARIAADIRAEHEKAFGSFRQDEIEACERVLASLLAAPAKRR